MQDKSLFVNYVQRDVTASNQVNASEQKLLTLSNTSI